MTVADELVVTVDAAMARLRTVPEAAAGARPASGGWSVKEIIGHLIDSAGNNNQRFVRAQQESPLALPGYAQDAWVTSQGYHDREWVELLTFWQLFNHHLATVMRRVPAAARLNEVKVGGGDPVTLGFLMDDYLVHLRHHLDQIDARLVRS